MRSPLAIDLFCGLGGWTEGLLAEGFTVIGFDIERRPYPAQLVLQDVLTLHGSQFRDAAVIVASPPCTEPSYRAMPWKAAKAQTPEEVGCAEPAWWNLPEYRPAHKRKPGDAPCMNLQDMAEWAIWKQMHPKPPPEVFMALFEACFRIQREASEAAGRHIPLVVENVKGAQPWVGRAKWHFGSFYLWGDVPALMPPTSNRRMKFPADCGPRMWKDREVPRLNGENGHAFHQKLSVESSGLKRPGRTLSEGFNNWPKDENGAYVLPDGTTVGGDGIKNARNWWSDGAGSLSATTSSRSHARKAASAQIAKIPFPLAQWIARVYLPVARFPVEPGNITPPALA